MALHITNVYKEHYKSFIPTYAGKLCQHSNIIIRYKTLSLLNPQNGQIIAFYPYQLKFLC